VSTNVIICSNFRLAAFPYQSPTQYIEDSVFGLHEVICQSRTLYVRYPLLAVSSQVIYLLMEVIHFQTQISLGAYLIQPAPALICSIALGAAHFNFLEYSIKISNLPLLISISTKFLDTLFSDNILFPFILMLE